MEKQAPYLQAALVSLRDGAGGGKDIERGSSYEEVLEVDHLTFCDDGCSSTIGSSTTSSSSSCDEAEEADDKAGIQKSSAARLNALGFIRFLGAVHILAFHFWDRIGDLFEGRAGNMLMKSGHCWVPFYFALSGFVLTYAELGKPRGSELPLAGFMRRRLLTMYPLYFLSLALWFLNPLQITSKMWHTLGFQLLLLQTWPVGLLASTCEQDWICAIGQDSWNDPAWYLSNLTFMWLCWHFVYPTVRDLSTSASVRVFGALMLITDGLPAALYVLYGSRASGWPDAFLWPSMFSPLRNLPIFFSGVFLAKLFVARAAVPGASLDFLALPTGRGRCAVSATVALTGLVLVFLNADGLAWARAARTGVLMPLQLLLIWGLAAAEDPLARLCMSRPFIWGDQVAYGVYILQWTLFRYGEQVEALAARLFGAKILQADPWVQLIVVVLPVMIIFALLAEHLFARPLQRCLK